jgi:hypothetical protein
MVASGNTPTSSPSPEGREGRPVGADAGTLVDWDVVHPTHQRTADAMLEDLLLGQEPNPAPGWQCAEATKMKSR